MLRRAGIKPNNERQCDSTIFLPPMPKPTSQVKHEFSKPSLKHPLLSTIDGRLIYSICEKGLDVIDVFCDSVIFIPYCIENIYAPELIQITNDTFIYRVKSKVLKIQINFEEYCMKTVDEQEFERSFGCSERITGDRYIIYQWSDNYEHVCLNMFQISDIHVPIKTFRLNIESRLEPNFFGLFHIFNEKLYFFSKFGNQSNERSALNLGSLLVYDMETGMKEVQPTSNMPSFYYSPPSNVAHIQRLFIQRAFWVNSQLFLRIKEIQNQIPFYHLIVLDIATLKWRLIADVNIEMRTTALIDENSILTLVNFRPDNKEQIYYRIALKQPETLKNLSQFAVKRAFPNLYKMSVEQRVANNIPRYLPFNPLFTPNESNYAQISCQVNSIKKRISTIIRRLFNF